MTHKFSIWFIVLIGLLTYDVIANPGQIVGPQFRDFDLQLFRGLRSRLSSSPDNLVFSPSSIRTVLAMLREGAAGQTRRDLDGALGDTSRATSLLYPRAEDEGLDVANALFLSSSLVASPHYQTKVTSRFGAWLEYSDFSRPRSAAQKINEWVSRATKGHIEQLVNRDSLSSSTVLLIANAVHLHGKWSHPFPEASTRLSTFYQGHHPANSSGVQVPTMLQYNYFRYGFVSSLNAKVLELPFEEPEGLSMLVLLPSQRDGLARTLEHLRPHSLAEMLESMGEPVLVTVSLPRFSAHTAQPLNNILPQEVRGVFSPEADFSRIAQNSEQVRVSQALHKASLSVDEKGAVGSAVSAVTAILLNSGSPLEFNASHPFAYFIVDNRDRGEGRVEPVFMGYVVSVDGGEPASEPASEPVLSAGPQPEKQPAPAPPPPQNQVRTTPSPTRIFFGNSGHRNTPTPERRIQDSVRYPTPSTGLPQNSNRN